MSDVFDDQQRYFTPPGRTEPIARPSAPGEVFAGMLQSLYMDIVQQSFLALGGRVPVTLDELLGNRFEIHQAGWGSPAGSVQPGQIGDFEFGVIPVLQGFYWDYPTSFEAGRVKNVLRFHKSTIAGEEIYDSSGPFNMVEGVRPTDEQWASRIPLLTDELFAGPPPQ